MRFRLERNRGLALHTVTLISTNYEFPGWLFNSAPTHSWDDRCPAQFMMIGASQISFGDVVKNVIAFNVVSGEVLRLDVDQKKYISEVHVGVKPEIKSICKIKGPEDEADDDIEAILKQKASLWIGDPDDPIENPNEQILKRKQMRVFQSGSLGSSPDEKLGPPPKPRPMRKIKVGKRRKP